MVTDRLSSSPIEIILESALPKIRSLTESPINQDISVASLVIGEHRSDFISHLNGLEPAEKEACIQAVKCVALPTTDGNSHTSAWFTIRTVREMVKTPEGLRKFDGLDVPAYLNTVIKLFSPSQT